MVSCGGGTTFPGADTGCVTEDSVDAVVVNRSHNTQSSIQHQK